MLQNSKASNSPPSSTSLLPLLLLFNNNHFDFKKQTINHKDLIIFVAYFATNVLIIYTESAYMAWPASRTITPLASSYNSSFTLSSKPAKRFELSQKLHPDSHTVSR